MHAKKITYSHKKSFMSDTIWKNHPLTSKCMHAGSQAVWFHCWQSWSSWSWSWWLCWLGPCPGTNVNGKTGRALVNAGSRWGTEFPHQLCRHHFFCEAVPVRNSSDEEAVIVGVCFCTTQRETAAVVSVYLLMMLLEVKSDLLVVLIRLLFCTGIRKDSAGMAGMRPTAILYRRMRCFSLHLSCRDGRFRSFSIFVMEPGWQDRPVILFDKTGGMALNVFQLVNVSLLVWIPDHSTVFVEKSPSIKAHWVTNPLLFLIYVQL